MNPAVVLPELVDQALADRDGAVDPDGLAEVAEETAVRLSSRMDRLHTPDGDEPALFDLAVGLSILARRRGGVTWLGRHWCADGHDDCPGDGMLAWPSQDRVGAVYTPPWLATEIARHTVRAAVAAVGPLHTADTEVWRLRPLEQLLGLRIADIACGSGALLVAAARDLVDTVTAALVQAGLDEAVSRRAVAERVVRSCLYGVDLDPLAVASTRLCLALLAPHARVDAEVATRVVPGDALLTDPVLLWPHLEPWPGLDAVVGNPPWLGGGRITGVLGRDYRERLVREVGRGRRGSADLSAYFLLRAHDLLHRGGQLGMVFTNTIAQGATREVGLDQVVAEGGTIWRAIKNLEWPTDRASVHCSLVWISRAPVVNTELVLAGGVRPAGGETATTGRKSV
ncbi:DNA methyltransferase [Saccharothrix sp. HUAS TT1]|uniref:DNA methyltransferase n=1 Tax=unclassified Saccharothrix TaxID=2593673 RepID=UPI00345B8BE5